MDRLIDALDSNKGFISAIVGTLLIKFWIAALIPITGDEAYFVLWGLNPDLGFYDHPPMVGWILGALLSVSDNLVWLRLPSIALSTLIALLIYKLLADENRQSARLVALLYLLAPINLLAVLITTDTPLIFFGFLAFALIFLAEKKRTLSHYLLAGVCLGLAILSKYFVAFIGLGLIIYLFFSRHDKIHRNGIALSLITSLPFLAINLYWNYTHCWNNVLFNFFNRHQGDSGFSLTNPLLYVLMQLYLLSPVLLFYLWRHMRNRPVRSKSIGYRFVLIMFAVPTVLFGLLSLRNLIGLHWVLGFYPLFFMLLFWLLDLRWLRAGLKFTIVFSLIHLVAVGFTSTTSLESWQWLSKYPSIVLGSKPQDLLTEIAARAPGYQITTTGYSTSAILAYHGKQAVPVFGYGSRYGRQDDLLTDWSELGGSNIAILQKLKPNKAEFSPYFEELDVQSVSIRGAEYHLILGRGFKFAPYRDRVLKTIRATYYNIPSFLPLGGCHLCETYFAGKLCATND